jgi:hypothetical protein
MARRTVHCATAGAAQTSGHNPQNGDMGCSSGVSDIGNGEWASLNANSAG